MRGTSAAVVLLLGIAGCAGDGDGGGAVTIIRGAPDESGWLDLGIEAEGIDAADGTTVIVQVGMPDRPPERLGSAEVVVDGGGFAVHFPSVWELGLYKRKVLLVDADGDGACGAADTVVVDWSAAVEDVTMGWEGFFAGDCELFVADWPTQ